MTLNEIEKRQKATHRKFELAKQIKQLLTEAKKEHGQFWEEEFNEEILEMISED